MSIQFNKSDGPSLGVEVELQIVDLESRMLVPLAPESAYGVPTRPPPATGPPSRDRLPRQAVHAVHRREHQLRQPERAIPRTAVAQHDGDQLLIAQGIDAQAVEALEAQHAPMLFAVCGLDQ